MGSTGRTKHHAEPREYAVNLKNIAQIKKPDNVLFMLLIPLRLTGTVRPAVGHIGPFRVIHEGQSGRVA